MKKHDIEQKLNNDIKSDKLYKQLLAPKEEKIITEQIKYENKEICKKCGGYCCKKCGCDYFVSDFKSMKIDYLEQILETGKVSIVSTLYFDRLSNNKLLCIPKLYLRARNNNRDIIDLLSFKTRCSQLEQNGCHYDITTRPSGGIALIPSHDICYSKIDRLEELNKWLPYQKVLERLVKRYTQKSVIEKLKEDVENLVYNFFVGNYQDSFEEEIDEIRRLLPLLSECFPDECKRAIIKYQNQSKLVLPKILKKTK